MEPTVLGVQDEPLARAIRLCIFIGSLLLNTYISVMSHHLGFRRSQHLKTEFRIDLRLSDISLASKVKIKGGCYKK